MDWEKPDTEEARNPAVAIKVSGCFRIGKSSRPISELVPDKFRDITSRNCPRWNPNTPCRLEGAGLFRRAEATENNNVGYRMDRLGADDTSQERDVAT